MAQNYAIRFFDDDSLPLCKGGAPDWMFIRTRDGVVLYIHEDAVTPEALTEAWAAYRDMEPPVRLPLQLVRTAGVGGTQHCGELVESRI